MSGLSQAKETTVSMRKLIAGEMSKEVEDRQCSGNVVTKLMGLESLPQLHLETAAPWSISRSSSHCSLSSVDNHDTGKFHKRHREFKDGYEFCESHSRKGKCGGSMSDKQLDLVRQKFIEAKGLVTDDKLHKSKEFQEALAVLSSNKDLFINFLMESNSLFSQHLSEVQPVPPCSEAKRITVLRPSKTADAQKCVVEVSRGNQSKETALSIRETGLMDVAQPTRIVVLKPSSGKALDIKAIASSPPSYFDEVGDAETKEMAKEITRHIRETFKGHCRDETLSTSSSTLSNGYLADDGLLNTSNHKYQVASISNSEIMSSSSRHSSDYVHRFDSPFPCSSFSRVSVSQESFVNKEAKKRLSKRWAMMSLNGNTQYKKFPKASTALGDMLALSGTKVPTTTRSNEEKNKAKHETRRSISCIESRSDSLDTLQRSKSVPEIRLNGGTAVLGTSKPQAPRELMESTSLKSSWKVSNLFFFRNKKSNKEKTDLSLYLSRSQLAMPSDASQQQNISLGEGEIQNQDQPSPVSVLQPPFEEEYVGNPECSGTKRPWITQGEEMSLKFNKIDKSPPIGSLARVSSWEDESHTDLTYPGTGIKEDEDWYDFVKTVLTASGFSSSDPLTTLWHSPDSPLDPSLRDKLANKELLKRRKQRSNHKLVFDCVNEIIKETTSTASDTNLISGFDMVEHVWKELKDWNSLAVASAVRDEVVGKIWSRNLQIQLNNFGIEIEVTLLKELIEEAVFDLAR